MKFSIFLCVLIIFKSNPSDVYNHDKSTILLLYVI